MRPRKLLASLAFLGLVPASIVLTFAGARYGLYPSSAAPLVFGVVFVVLTGVVLYLQPTRRRHLPER